MLDIPSVQDALRLHLEVIETIISSRGTSATKLLRI